MYGHGSVLLGGKRLRLCNTVGRVVWSLPSRGGCWRTVTDKPLRGVDAGEGVHDHFGGVRPMEEDQCVCS